MNHKEYTTVKKDIMTTCRCREDQAQEILNRVTALGGNIRRWADELTTIMETAHPTAEDVIASLDQYAAESGRLDTSFGSFVLPEGYENRQQRRQKERQTKRRKPKPVFRYNGRR